MPEFLEDSFVDPSPPRPITAFDIVFAIIAILASGFSGYTTYLGFSYDLPFLLSLVMAIIVGLGLLIINFKIKENRVRGEDVGRTLIAFLLFFVVSFISNTNAIYTYFLKNDIVGETQIAAWHTFDEGTQEILTALGQNQVSMESARIKQSLDIARRNLRNQITDAANPGLGPRAREHLEEVETILGVELTRLQPPGRGAPMARFDEYAYRLDDQIESAFATQHQTTRSLAHVISTFAAKINKLRSLYSDQINRKEYDSNTTDLMQTDLASIYLEAEKLIGYSGPRPQINNATDDIGSFQYTWNNFYNLTNVPAIILSIILSIMLDILTPVLSLLLYKCDVEF